MSELQTLLNNIINNKTNNLKPENLKHGVTCLGVTGTLEEGIKQFISVEEMNQSTGNKNGDKAIVYSQAIIPITEQIPFDNLIFPHTCVITNTLTEMYSCIFDSKDHMANVRIECQLGYKIINIEIMAGWVTGTAEYSIGDDEKTLTLSSQTGLTDNKIEFKPAVQFTDAMGQPFAPWISELLKTNHIEYEGLYEYNDGEWVLKGKPVKNQEKVITDNGTYTPDAEHTGFDKVTVNVPKGIDTSDATATADDIINPKTAYVNNRKITGTIIPEGTKELTTTNQVKQISSNNISAPTKNHKCIISIMESSINIYDYATEELKNTYNFTDLNILGIPREMKIANVIQSDNSSYYFVIRTTNSLSPFGGNVDNWYALAINTKNYTVELKHTDTINSAYGDQSCFAFPQHNSDIVAYISRLNASNQISIYNISTGEFIEHNKDLFGHIESDFINLKFQNNDTLLLGSCSGYNNSTIIELDLEFRVIKINLFKKTDILNKFCWIEKDKYLSINKEGTQLCYCKVNNTKISIEYTIDIPKEEYFDIYIPIYTDFIFTYSLNHLRLYNLNKENHTITLIKEIEAYGQIKERNVQQFMYYSDENEFEYMTSNSIKVSSIFTQINGFNINKLTRLGKTYIDTTDATAAAADIKSGSTAYAKDTKLTGTLTFDKFDPDYTNCLSKASQIEGSIPLENPYFVKSLTNQDIEPDKYKSNIRTWITEIPKLDTSNVTNMHYMFANCTNLTTIPVLDTSKVTDMGYMFTECSSLTEIPLIDTSNVTNMHEMFANCTSLTTIPQLDTSKVTSMTYMFSECSSLTTIPLLNTSNVTNMERMFFRSNLTSIPLIDTSNVTNMTYMFYNSDLTTIPQLDTSNVTNMTYMFANCTKLTTIPLLNTSNVTNMYGMFNYCTHLTTIPLLNTSNVTNMEKMFQHCFGLTAIPLLDTSKVTNMYAMFDYCTDLTTIPVLDTSKVTSMTYMFSGCTKLSDESLNNILQMCINAVSYTKTKTLDNIGLSREQVARCESLSNWQAFLDAGWAA